jgi:hypothetical protein
MIEMSMFFALGFLAASLLVVVVVPFVHNRAERLTKRRIEALLPQSIAEIHANRDQLRAEFAVSTRRLELSNARLWAKTASQLVELGKKAAVINRLKVELDVKTAKFIALNKRAPPFRAAGAFLMKAGWQAERTLAKKEAEIARLNGELDERSRTAASQRIEIVALKIQVDMLNDRIAGLDKRSPQERGDPERPRALMRLVR